jgi:signal transduction histidine kinase
MAPVRAKDLRRKIMGAALAQQRLQRRRRGPPSSHQNEARLPIYATKISSQYQQIPMILTVDIVNASLVAAVIAAHIDNWRSAMFFGSVCALALVRGVIWALRRARPSIASDQAWAFSAVVCAGLSGALWGLGGALLLPQTPFEQALFAFVIGVMCAAPLVSFSYHLPTFLAYAVPATAPLAGRFLLQGGDVNIAMGDMLVVFAASIAIAAYHSNRTFTNLLRLNFALERRTAELSATNERLNDESRQRAMAEEQLRQAQKMEAIGHLTGGIAHDFNNLLTGVLGHLELACKRVGDDPRTAALLRSARHAAERGASLTRHLLAFARRQHLDPKPVDVRNSVNAMEQILRQTIGPDIHVSVEIPANVCTAWADPNELELAILNLALNARDAMPEGGTLRISAEDRREEGAAGRRDLLPGDYVLLSVADTGTGMTEETLAHAFEPFFTTKGAGVGSGLGLSMVHGFAAQSGGTIHVESAVGHGTKVSLWLPRAQDRASEDAAVDVAPAIESPGSGRILVCDDDDDVRGFVVDALREGNYSVWEADRPSSALRILKQAQPIDLLLADYALPEMKGPALIDRALSLQPRLKALLMTGYAEALRNGGANGIPMMGKPFRVAELRQRIAELISAPPQIIATEVLSTREEKSRLPYPSPAGLQAAAVAGD